MMVFIFVSVFFPHKDHYFLSFCNFLSDLQMKKYKKQYFSKQLNNKLKTLYFLPMHFQKTVSNVIIFVFHSFIFFS